MDKRLVKLHFVNASFYYQEIVNTKTGAFFSLS
jgi:hypothetical protein